MILNAIGVGLIISAILGASITVTEIFWPNIYAHDYPKAIQEKARLVPMNRRQKSFSAIFIVLSYLMAVGGIVIALAAQFHNIRDYWPVFFYLLTVFMTFNLFDLLILDWLIFNTLTPKQICLPGTEGMKDYKNYWFNFVGFLKGIMISILMAFVTSAPAFLMIRYLF